MRYRNGETRDTKLGVSRHRKLDNERVYACEGEGGVAPNRLFGTFSRARHAPIRVVVFILARAEVFGRRERRRRSTPSWQTLKSVSGRVALSDRARVEGERSILK